MWDYWHGGWQKPRKSAKVGSERHYKLWGEMSRPGRTGKKQQKGGREISKEWNTFDSLHMCPLCYIRSP